MLLRLSFILACWFCAIQPVEAKRVALVVGNSQYKSFSVLPNPVNDAKLMEKALRDSGFEVTLILDADQAQMKRAILAFGRTLRKGVDASMFFYAGHGVQVNGENYLIPTDADLESEDEVGVQTIDVNAFLQTMESAKSPFNIIVLDACRNNPLSAHRGGGGGLAPVQAPKGSFVAYSTAAGKIALDGEGINNSPYTLALSQTLALPGLRLEDVFKKTRELVLASTIGEQVPFESTSITGDFYFKEPETFQANNGKGVFRIFSTLSGQIASESSGFAELIVDVLLTSDGSVSANFPLLKKALQKTNENQKLHFQYPIAENSLDGELHLKKYSDGELLEAFLIGGTDYKFVTPLPVVKKQFDVIEPKLKVLGFNVVRYDNANRSDVRKLLLDRRKLLETDKRERVVIVYLNGHGVSLEGTDYYIPVDASPESATDVELEGVPIKDFEGLGDGNTGLVLIADLGRNDPFEHANVKN